MSELETEIHSAIQSNCILFMRRAASEIVLHDDSLDEPFSRETATMVSVLTQMALELSMVGFIVKHEGIRAILRGNKILTDDEIRHQWTTNDLVTKSFTEHVECIKNKYGRVFVRIEGAVDAFQTTRNKIMHIFYKFADGDMYDVKYDSVLVIFTIIIHLFEEHDYEWPRTFENILSEETFQSLLNNEAFIYQATKIADVGKLLNCPMCNKRSYAAAEARCFLCGYEHETLDLAKCQYCADRSAIYDALNLDINDSLPSLCLSCGHKGAVFKCPNCGCVSSYSNGKRLCEFCD